MGADSKIEWTDATWNPVRGCTRVSEGCRNCYAEAVAARFSGPGQPYEGLAERTSAGPRWTGKVRLIADALDLPLRWRKPKRIFVNSMSDLFHEGLSDADIDRVFAVMALAWRHTFQVLTKRPERMRAYLGYSDGLGLWEFGVKERAASEAGRLMEDGCNARDAVLNGPWPLPNVWLGVSIEDQATADARVPVLLDTPAAVRFVSAEPLLGPIDLTRVVLGECDAEFFAHPEIKRAIFTLDSLRGAKSINRPPLDWVICGGESGPGARPMHPDWARSLRDQCAAVCPEVPFHFKQHGQHIGHSCVTWDHQGAHTAQTFGRPSFEAHGERFWTVGKKAAGRLLDGAEHNGMPEARHG